MEGVRIIDVFPDDVTQDRIPVEPCVQLIIKWQCQMWYCLQLARTCADFLYGDGIHNAEQEQLDGLPGKD